MKKRSSNILTPIKKAVSLCVDAYRKIHELEEPPFLIEEINISEKKVVIRNKGACAILKLTIYETILDPLLISNLPSTQACWLGYYFGSLYNDNSSADKGFLSNRKDNSFSLSFARGRFKVSSQDRKGNITYIDIYTKKIYSESPLSVAQNVSIIKNFDPSQACYIGILAGILATKNSTSTVTISKPKPALMVIK